MISQKRILVLLCTLLAGVILVGSVGIWWAVQSGWLKDKIRERILAEVETTTGGRVELGGFTYDWQTLSAEFTNFTVHGSEPAGSPPLLHIESLRLRLKIISLLERDVDISSLAITHPDIHLLVRKDGTTNVPTPRLPSRNNQNAVEQLLALKVGRLELTQGSLQVNDRRLPLNLSGDQVSLFVNYNRRRLRTEPSYDIKLSSRSMLADSSLFRPLPFGLTADLRLERDRLNFRELSLRQSGSGLYATATLNHFASPRIDFHTELDIEANEIGRLTPYRDISGGRLSLNGGGHYDQAAGLSFAGEAHARNASYVTKWFAIRDVTLDSAVTASNEGLVFKRMVAVSRGAKFSGEALVKRFRSLEINGAAAGFQVNEMGSYLPLMNLPQPLPWSASATGRVHLTVDLDPKDANFLIQTNMHLIASSAGIPVGGDVDLTYRQRCKALEFGNSLLSFPSSQLSFAGPMAGQLVVKFDTSNLNDIRPLLDAAASALPARSQPQLLAGGSVHFSGTLNDTENPKVNGQLTLVRFSLEGQTFDRFQAHVSASAAGLDFQSLELQQSSAKLTGSATAGTREWLMRNDSPIHADLQFQGYDIVKTIAQFSTVKLPVTAGLASGSLTISGSIQRPLGSAHVTSDSLDAYGQRLNQLQFDASLNGDRLQLTGGRVRSGGATLAFSGDYQHSSASWQAGQVHLKVESNAFSLAGLPPAHKLAPSVNAQAQIHLDATARVAPNLLEPLGADGTLEFRKITIGDVPYGDLTVVSTTRQRVLNAVVTGDLRGARLRGSAQAQLVPGDPIRGEVRFERIGLATLYALSGKTPPYGMEGFAQGGLTFDGPLAQPQRLHAALQVDHLEFSSQIKAAATAQASAPNLVFRNSAPIVIEMADGVAAVRSFQIAGKNTVLAVTGSASPDNLDIKVAGSADLQIFDLFDPNVTSSGLSTVSATVAGTYKSPLVNGTLELKNGSFFFRDLPNGLSAVNGTVTFNRNRATLQKMTATSGGGDLSLGGFLSFGAGSPLVYHLEGNAQNVRVRYAGSISVTANSSLRLSGTSTSSILSGTLTISRVVFNPNTDVGNLLASFGGGATNPLGDNEFLTGLHLDVEVESAPNLQLNTALSRDVEAEIALRLRGTPDHPVLLGSLTANQGDIKVFGSRYSINRGQVNFVNAVKIEPVLDLDLETQTRGISVDITISGTLSKLNLNYRSDPPLQPRDIIALLTVGRAPTVTNASNQQAVTDTSALQSGANTVLGQAISPVSNRLSKLFGITNIKIDPLVQGITNTPQARLTLEQQISRNITITYVTNLSQTSEQIFRMEWALNRQFSLVALRDDNGEFGIDLQFKKRFK